ncbi:hypothetical protein D3C78_1039920 [compost metagenome]
MVFICQHLNEHILNLVRILKLIDHNILEALLKSREKRLVAAKQSIGLQQQVVVVELALLRLPFFIARI